MKTFKKAFYFPLLFLSLLFNIATLHGDTYTHEITNFKADSYIINLGVTPQTNENGLLPYGLVYDMVINHEIPVYWIINTQKSLFETDFSYGGTDYKSSAFVIPAIYITSAVQSSLDDWEDDGVVMSKASSDFDAPVFNYISSFPNAVLDDDNDDLVTKLFYDEAAIPDTYYTSGTPGSITTCSDVYALPHADPQDWSESDIATYVAYVDSRAQNFLWQGCHSVGAVEAHAVAWGVDPSLSGTKYLNMPILTTHGQIAWKDDPDYKFKNKNKPPYTYEPSSGGHPIMQIAEKLDDGKNSALLGGSQEVYIPRPPRYHADPQFDESDSDWRDTTTVAIWEESNDNNKLNSTALAPDGNNRKAALLAFGRAYGESKNGILVQHASHEAKHSSKEYHNVSSARIYGNLLLQSSIAKRPIVTIDAPPNLYYPTTYEMNASVARGDGPFDYKWDIQCDGVVSQGVFIPDETIKSASRTNEVEFQTANETFDYCILRVRVTDGCGRKNFATKFIGVGGSSYNPPIGSYNITHTGVVFPSDKDSINIDDPVNSLYTQISDTPFDVVIVALEEDDKETLENKTGNVILEMIFTGGITIEDAKTCAEAGAISDQTGRVSLSANGAHFDNNATVFATGITYPNALEYLAFRVSRYDFSLPAGDVFTYGIPSTMTKEDLDDRFPDCSDTCVDPQTDWSCYKCISNSVYLGGYGNASCSRDSFSIRPREFSLGLDLDGDNNYIAGREYTLDINATTNADVNDILYTERNDGQGLLFSPIDSRVTSEFISPVGCSLNDDNQTFDDSTLSFTQGNGTLQYSFNNVGDINITAFDPNWTLIDREKSFNGVTYSDCIEDSSSNIRVNGKIGCVIEGENNVSFVPFAFRNTLTLLNNDVVDEYTYIADQDFNQSAKLRFTYTAVIEDNTTATILDNPIATNYIQDCFSKNFKTSISLDNNRALGWSDTEQRIWIYDANATDYLDTLPASLNHPSELFTVGTPGSATADIPFNYDRATNTVENPFQIFRNDFDVNVSEIIDPTISGDDFDRTTADTNATFYYGRTHTPRNRFVGPTGDAFIYYEVFCNGAVGGVNCDKRLLQNGLNSKVTDDPRWFKNEDHDVTTDGSAGAIVQKDGAGLVTSGALVNIAGRTTAPLTYNRSKGYPYKTTMINAPSDWLIYNRYDANATVNEFEVEFVNAGGQWAGKEEAGSTTKEVGSSKTNRRSMW